MNSLSKPVSTNNAVLEVPDLPNQQALKQWIEDQHKAYELQYLLAHAEDGVIWGRFEKSQLITAECLWPQSPLLQPSTLQQCRIFGKNAEVMLWRKDNGWQARVIQDKNMKQADHIVEKQMLWGSWIKKTGQGFTLLVDGQQGLKHAVPITVIITDQSQKKTTPLKLVCLNVKHYIKYDDVGIAFIYRSRLLDLTLS